MYCCGFKKTSIRNGVEKYKGIVTKAMTNRLIPRCLILTFMEILYHPVSYFAKSFAKSPNTMPYVFKNP
jgi:hypothetical protein